MEPTVILWIVAILVVGAVAWALGGRRVRERYRRTLEALARPARQGGDVPGSVDRTLPGVAGLTRAVEEAPEGVGGGAPSAGTAPAETSGPPSAVAPDASRLIRTSLGRIADYLREGVETPLREALGQGGDTRTGAEDALLAVEDLYFYLREVPEGRSTEDLNEIARQAVDEYRDEWDTEVDVHVPERPTEVEVNREALLDALYLILHNADQFGGGEPVEVVVRYQDGDCWLVVRDQGEGFGQEAMERGFEPFYSTSPRGLGLGLFHARKIVESMDGEIALRNRRKGGGQVEIVLPEAEA